MKYSNQIVEYINLLKQVDNKNNDYYNWKLENLQFPEVKSYKESPELKELVQEYLKFSKIEKKQCHKNAFLLACFNENITLHSGYMLYHLPIEHSWNSYKGFHFDLTIEIALEQSNSQILYGSIVRTIVNKDTIKEVTKRGYYGSHLYESYLKSKDNLSEPKTKGNRNILSS